MADIRKRAGEKGVTYQVRFRSNSTKSGYAFKAFKTMKEARHFAAQCEINNPQHTASKKRIKVKDAVELWLRICEKTGRDGRETVEPQTLVEYRRRANVICEYPWEKYLHELTPIDIQNLRTWLLEHKSRDLARRCLSSFHSVLLEMKMQGYIQTDPGAGITIRSGGRYDDGDSEIEIPSDQEVRDLLCAADVMGQKNGFMETAWARYRPMIYLPVFTGLRMSENRGMPWQGITPSKVTIRQRADKLGIIGPVKSKAAKRTIEVSSFVTDMLFEWKERCPMSENDLVFSTSGGRPIGLTNFHRDAWVPLFRKADLMEVRTKRGVKKLRPKYTPHALRHYYASKLIEKSKDLKFIQERMGHSRIEITLNVYGHLMKGREEEHQQTADELAAELLPI